MSDTIRYVENPLSVDRPGVGANLIYMAVEGVLFFVLTLLLEVIYCICLCTLSHGLHCVQSGFFCAELRGVFVKYIQGHKTRPETAVEPLLLHGEVCY